MPWKEASAVDLRRELVMLAQCDGANVRELCRRFGVSPTTAYKWLDRFEAGGEAGLADRSRRPRGSPARTGAAMAAAILELRDKHPAWGGRKLRRRLLDLGHEGVPSASTITEVLRRHGRIDPAEAGKHTAWQRFERAAPNELWQIDFKGHFALASGRCHTLTVLDDHSRFALAVEACGDEREATVRQRLTAVFRRYGLPERMLADNGPPWGSAGEDAYTALEAWLIQLGVALGHGRPCHPQTQGKEERFHRTLLAEAIGSRSFRDLAQCQAAFSAWRQVYNLERPHQALGLATPASRYRASLRAFPEVLPEPAYGPDDIVRKVHYGGRIGFGQRVWRVGRAFIGKRVALRPAAQDGTFNVYFCHQRIAGVDLTLAE